MEAHLSLVTWTSGPISGVSRWDSQGRGKPINNVYIEEFNSKLRSECPNAHWFMSFEDTAKKLAGLV